MMRSLYSGVSGLRTHQTKMDVIGNNIANVNTTAFKAKQMNFSDMLYQTTQAGTAANAANGTGGTNPRQIGLGVKTAAINTTITQEGANQSTGNPFDLKLTGEAFFVVSDGTSTFYTRDGSFDVDDAGNLVMASTGYIVQGWGVNEDGDIVQGTLGGINVTAQDTYGAAATTQARINGILDRDDVALEDVPNGKTVPVGPIYDNAGYSYDLRFGILPATTLVGSTMEITNYEAQYQPEQTLYSVDLSTLKYNYIIDANDTPMELKSSDVPKELLEELEKDVWAAVNGGTAATGITVNTIGGNAHKPGDAGDWISVDLGAYIGAKTTLNDAIVGDSKLRLMKVTVNFSGGIGFSKEAPSYPLKNTDTIKADPAALVAMGYTEANGVYTRQQNDPMTAIRQTYTEDGESKTEYIFVDAAHPAPDGITTQDPGSGETVNIGKLYASDIMSVLGLNDPMKTDTYTSVENKTSSKADPGKYKLTLLGITDGDGKSVNIDALTNAGATTWDLVYNTSDGSFSYVGSEGNSTFTVNLNSLGDNFENLTIDMSNSSNASNDKKSTLTGPRVDGRRLGTRTGVSVGTDGIVRALYSNGMSRNIGQICVGTFPNAMGLENAGDNLYQVTASSGDVNIVDIKASGTGSITTGVLEMSNVDLSQQFTDMITTQRGFQANSRTVTVSDTLLEELINLKR